MLRYWWVILAVLGFLPALLLTNVLLESVTAADWSCTRVEFGASGSQYGGCSIIAGELIVVVVISWIAPLSVLVALLYLLRRRHRGEGDRAVRSETTGADDTAVDRTGIFVRAVAVLVGLANAIFIGEPRNVFAASEGLTLAPLFGALLLAAVAGLLASEIVLRVGRPALSGGFFTRYGIAVLGLCLGGAILGGSSVALGLLTGQPGTQNTGGVDPILLWAALAYGLIAAVVGGVMGALEGLILGLPLATMLGKLGPPRDRARGGALPSAALFGLLVVAVISYAAAPSRSSDTSPPARAGLPPNGLPVSCPGGEEDRGYFNSFGDDTTPDLLSREPDGATSTTRRGPEPSTWRYWTRTVKRYRPRPYPGWLATKAAVPG